MKSQHKKTLSFHRVAIVAIFLHGGCQTIPQAPLQNSAPVMLTNIPVPFQENADRWNHIFQKQPGTEFGWSGGDAVLSVELPDCAQCPANEKSRRLWFFGDSAFSQVDDAGYRIVRDGSRGAQFTFGNVAAMTSAADLQVPAQQVVFDYGANGVQSNAWMPLLIEPRSLPDMDDLRVAAQGYESLGFQRDRDVVAWVYSLKSLMPASLHDDAVPVYEFYNPEQHAVDYRRSRENTDDGFHYQRIAFFLQRHPRPGMVALKRQVDASGATLIVAPAPTAADANTLNQPVLGYAYADASAQESLHPLIAYTRNNPVTGLRQKMYTTHPNDQGKPILMWPNRPYVMGDDLLQVFSPVTPLSLPGMVSWDEIDANVVAVVRGVNRPYAQWGKTLHGDWRAKPVQQVLHYTRGDAAWGHMVFKDADYQNNGLVYVYGLRGNALLVARLVCRTADDFLDFGRWQFLRDGQWQAKAEGATAIATDVGTGFSIVRSPQGRIFLFHSSPVLAPEIQIQTASSPAGDFEKYRVINLRDYANERERASRYTYYAVSVHDNLSYGGDDAGVMISYVRSCSFSVDAACQGKQSDDGRADVYVPRFINLPWTLLE